MEETQKKKQQHPSLPPNYVSILDLRHQWLLQKQLQENAEDYASCTSVENKPQFVNPNPSTDKLLQNAGADPQFTASVDRFHRNSNANYLKQKMSGVEGCSVELHCPDRLMRDQTVRDARKTPSAGRLRRKEERRNREIRGEGMNRGSEKQWLVAEERSLGMDRRRSSFVGRNAVSKKPTLRNQNLNWSLERPNSVQDNPNMWMQRRNAVLEEPNPTPENGSEVEVGDFNERQNLLQEKRDLMLETHTAVVGKGNEAANKDCVVNKGKGVSLGDDQTFEIEQSPENLRSMLEKPVDRKDNALLEQRNSELEKQNGVFVEKAETEESLGEGMEFERKMKDVAVSENWRRARTSTVAYDSRRGRPNDRRKGRTYWRDGRGERRAYQNCRCIERNEVPKEGNSVREKHNDSENRECVEKRGGMSSGDRTADSESPKKLNGILETPMAERRKSSLDRHGVAEEQKLMPDKLIDAENGECVDSKEGDVNLNAQTREVEHKMKGVSVRGNSKKNGTLGYDGGRGRTCWSHSSGERRANQNYGLIGRNEVLEEGNSAQEKRNDLINRKCVETVEGQVSSDDQTAQVESPKNLNGMLETPMPDRRKLSLHRHDAVLEENKPMPQKLIEAEDSKEGEVKLNARAGEIEHKVKKVSVRENRKKAWSVAHNGGRERTYWYRSRGEHRVHQNFWWIERKEVLEEGNSAQENRNDLNRECEEKEGGPVSSDDQTAKIKSLKKLNGILELPMSDWPKSSLERHIAVLEEQNLMPQNLNEAENEECADNKEAKVNVNSRTGKIERKMKEVSVRGKLKKNWTWTVAHDGWRGRTHRSYTRSERRAYSNYRIVEHRLCSEVKREDGLVWVKKSEPSE